MHNYNVSHYKIYSGLYRHYRLNTFQKKKINFPLKKIILCIVYVPSELHNKDASAEVDEFSF